MKKILDILRIPATVLSGLGLIYTIYIHLNAIDYADPAGDKIPGFLTLGLFVIWPIAVGVAVFRQKELKVENPDFRTRLIIFYKCLLGEAPTLVVIITVAVYLHANYYGWTHSYEGFADIIDGKMVLQSHGQIIKELTEAEFLQYRAEQIRLSTANLMIFYGVGTGVLFPRLKKSES